MNKNNEFLTIGELAKITGATKKAILYYEKSSILKPAYVNPENGYRFYSLSQVPLVETIQICTLLDIPLKDLNNFIDHNQSINYTSFFDYGIKLAEMKIRATQHGLDFFHYAQEEMAKFEKYKNAKEPYTRNIPEKFYLVSPYHPEHGEKAIYTEMSNLFEKSMEKNFIPLFERGVLYEYLPDEIKRYVFMEIMPTDASRENLKVIPANNYICTFVQDRQIEEAPELFPELFEEKEYVLVIETEIIADNSHENLSTSELRILLN